MLITDHSHWPQPRQRFGPVPRLAYQIEPAIPLEKGAQALPNDGMVIRDQNANRHWHALPSMNRVGLLPM
jgi:hypothetical protein